MDNQIHNIEKQVLARMKRAGRGTLFFPENFASLASTAAIRKALQRLTENKEIVRVAHGIYTIPEIDTLLGPIAPSIEAIAVAIAKRDKATIVPTGVYALNRLGLSTQVPLNIIYLTDGAARKVKIGKQSIKFKKTTPKNLLAKGPISSLVIQALRAIGKDKVGKQELDKVCDLLKKERIQNLQHDIKLAPAWIADILKKALNPELWQHGFN